MVKESRNQKLMHILGHLLTWRQQWVFQCPHETQLWTERSYIQCGSYCKEQKSLI